MVVVICQDFIYDSCLYTIVIVMHTILNRLQTPFFFPKVGPKFQFYTCSVLHNIKIATFASLSVDISYIWIFF